MNISVMPSLPYPTPNSTKQDHAVFARATTHGVIRSRVDQVMQTCAAGTARQKLKAGAASGISQSPSACSALHYWHFQVKMAGSQ